MKRKSNVKSEVELTFIYKGYKCIIISNYMEMPEFKIESLEKFTEKKGNVKWFCGYVGVNKSHLLYKISKEVIKNKIDTKRSITLCSFGDGKFLPKDRKWYIGFDTFMIYDKDKSDIKKIKTELKDLVNQLTTKNLILNKLE